jgi:hypothetical protein
MVLQKLLLILGIHSLTLWNRMTHKNTWNIMYQNECQLHGGWFVLKLVSFWQLVDNIIWRTVVFSSALRALAHISLITVIRFNMFFRV